MLLYRPTIRRQHWWSGIGFRHDALDRWPASNWHHLQHRRRGDRFAPSGPAANWLSPIRSLTSRRYRHPARVPQTPAGSAGRRRDVVAPVRDPV